MPRLVVVSNRVAVPGETVSAGGLAVAIRDVLLDRGGLWFGWSGKITAEPLPAPSLSESGGTTYATVDFSPAEHHNFYCSYSNSTLWPLLHSRLGLLEFKREAFEGYLKVNRNLAAALLPLLKPGDIVWVHDYHLIPLGAALRALGVTNRIGFFLHTPFPPAELMQSLPQHERLMEAIAAYDVIGLQTARDVRGFLAYVSHIALGQVFPNGAFQMYGRLSRVLAQPIGIDTQGFVDLAKVAHASPEVKRLKASLAGRHLIVGVDRLDYSKALPMRFEAIDRLLTNWPRWRGQFTYLQITPHSRGEIRQYRSLRTELETAAGHVNGKFAEFDWTPIRYLNKTFDRRKLAGIYRSARIGLVTPFRDGMNLVAKEYVAAQDPADPGVLVLSRFAGAANELTSALLINPYDADEIAGAINKALEMSLLERRQRFARMIRALQENTVQAWRDGFLTALRAGAAADGYRAGGRVA